jgi:hypothetical protein
MERTMTSRPRIDFVLILGAVLWSLQACGQRIVMDGSTPGLPDGEAPAEEPAIEDVIVDSGFQIRDLPMLEPASYDYSLMTPTPVPAEELSESEAGSMYGLTRTRSISGSEEFVPPDGGFSRAGCEADSIKQYLFEDARKTDLFLCYLGEIQKADPAMIVPKDQWAYYEVTVPKAPDGETTMRKRVGQFGSEFRMDACGQTNGSYVRAIELRMKLDSTKTTGHVTRAGAVSLGGVQSIGNSKLTVDVDKDSGGNVTRLLYKDHARSFGVTGGSISLEAAFEFDAEKRFSDDDDRQGVNTAYGELRRQSTEGVTFFDMNLWGRWNWDGKGAAQLDLFSESVPPTQEDCVAFLPDVSQEIREEECVGKCFIGEGDEVDPNGGKCEVSINRTESFAISDPSDPPIHFSIDGYTDSNPFYRGATEHLLLNLIDDAGDPPAFEDTWNCQNSKGFVALDTAGESKANMIACGLAYMPRAALTESCDKQIWAQWLPDPDDVPRM